MASYIVIPIFLESSADFFQIAPKNVSIFYNTPKRFRQICVPPTTTSRGDFSIEWWKDGVHLAKSDENNTRINITEITYETIITTYRVSNGSLVSELSIDPVDASDSGEYSCKVTNKSTEFVAKFVVIVTGMFYSCKFRVPQKSFV